MKRLFTVALLGAIFGLAVGVGLFVVTASPSDGIASFSIEAFDRPASTEDRSVVFTVNPGEGAGSIGDRLEQFGLINSGLLFRLLVQQYNVERNLAAGEYELSPAMTTTAIIQKLNKGVVRTTTVTIPEGLRNGQIVTRLDRAGTFPRAEFEAALNQLAQSPVVRGLIPEGRSVEGFLLPDTYRIEPSMRADQFALLMFTSFDRQFTQSMRDKVSAQGLTPYQAVVLASIVEREAVNDEERPIIASVFYNRLKVGMPLQADPTVQFALTLDPRNVEQFGWWKTGLTVTDLRVQSPYNTYVSRGLPPGPIANPGIASLRAVAEPATTDYFYFVAKDSRSHLFARTLEEHNRNVASVQR